MRSFQDAPAALGWDADGVVVDSKAVAWGAMEDIASLFRDRPQILSAADKTAAFGPQAQVGMAGEDGAPTLRSMHRILMRHRTHKIRLFDDALDLVARLVSRPWLITAAYSGGIREVLGRRAGLFRSIRGCEDGPKDRLIAEAADTGMAWYVCDTVVDVRRCRESGVSVIAVGWGYDDCAELIAAGPAMLARTPRDLEVALDDLGFLSSIPANGGSR
ncbi:MAG: HAD family hydrolase [Bryobacteraceae bacterium]